MVSRTRKQLLISKILNCKIQVTIILNRYIIQKAYSINIILLMAQMYAIIRKEL